MPTSEPLHVAFVWHMHQPYYRSARTGAFEMPWARMHALKDYLAMVESLTTYPDLHQTFNLVPCLVEQLEDYASGDFIDVYWEHTLKPAADLDPAERTFVVERMCEHSDHPRARSHPRYLELALKREAQASQGWEACARTFTVGELRDLQIWFNLAWFDPQVLEAEPLRELVSQGRDFREEHKDVLAVVQADILTRTLPAYRDAARRGQVELSTSPYFHPILPLLANSDAARIAAADTVLPPSRFAHPEDAAEQVKSAVAMHARVFGERPRGMWCSEQAVGEDTIPLMLDSGLTWTISDETVLSRSFSGVDPRREFLPSSSPLDHVVPVRTLPIGSAVPAVLTPESLHTPYRLEREGREMAIVFRDHGLSDLIGFAYRSWDSRDAATDLLRRLRELRVTLASAPATPVDSGPAARANAGSQIPLVTIALDGENAWEYYPRDGHDFLRYLYEGLSSDPALRCVTISEHLRESPPTRSLDWLHTGSWIGGDLRTWSGDRTHNVAWDLLHQARDLAAARHSTAPADRQAASAWRHVLAAEGSDWFWWFGEHHHTELDRVWDLSFRCHLQEVYRSLGEPVPMELFLPILNEAPSALPALPQGPISPTIDGSMGSVGEWEAAGYLAPDLPSTMQRAEGIKIAEVRFGWHADHLCLLVVPGGPSVLEGLEMELRVTRPEEEDEPVVRMTLKEGGTVEVGCLQCPSLAGTTEAAWKEVVEISLPFAASALPATTQLGLVLSIGRNGMIEHVFNSAGLTSLGWEGQ